MGRTATVSRRDEGARAARALAVVLAALALLLCGTVEVLPRSLSGPLAAGSAAAAPLPKPPTARGGALDAPVPTVGVRAAGLAVVPAPNGPGSGLPPTADPVVAPHLVADPQRRAATSGPVTSPSDSSSSRAPPAATGT